MNEKIAKEIGEKVRDVNVTITEYGELLLTLGEIQKELEKHKLAIRFLLSTNKQFQNEIQKKEFKKTQGKEQETPIP